MKKILKTSIFILLLICISSSITFASSLKDVDNSHEINTTRNDENNLTNEVNTIENEINNSSLQDENIISNIENTVSENKELYSNTSTVVKINGIWRMVKNGVVDYNYTGIGTNENGTWYLENGKVTFTYTGTYTEENKAYIIEESKVYDTVTTSTTSVIKINNTWRMVKNGIVDYKYNGIGTNSLGTWLLQNGKVTFNYTGNYRDANGITYVVEKSEVMTKYTKVMKIDNVWRMVKKRSSRL